MRTEIRRRYGDDADVVYRDAESDEVRAQFAETLGEIEGRGLLYPVTVVDGVPLYDGAVSYPTIMRAVHNKLLEREQPQEA